MNRGSDAIAGSHSQTPASFNEAPIHESGKCYRRLHHRQPPTGFNEAPIHESGKFARPRAM